MIYRCGPPVFDSAPNEGPQWGVLEEQRLLSLIRAYKIDDWLVLFSCFHNFLYLRPKIALTEFGRVRTVDEAMNHFNRCFLNGPISEIVLEGMIRSVFINVLDSQFIVIDRLFMRLVWRIRKSTPANFSSLLLLKCSKRRSKVCKLIKFLLINHFFRIFGKVSKRQSVDAHRGI